MAIPEKFIIYLETLKLLL